MSGCLRRAHIVDPALTHRACLIAICGSILMLSGCPDRPKPDAPTSSTAAVEVINQNLRKIDGPVVASGLVRMKFRNSKGATSDTGLLDAKLVYEAPRRFRMEV